MAVTIVGEVVNTCDSVTGFNTGSFGTDDAAWEGTGAIGIKASATTIEFYTTTADGGGLGFPYDFSPGGAEFGYHMICWFNTKTPVDATNGLTIIMGNGVDRGRWNVIGGALYPGGWSSRVINTAEDFDLIAAGAWTLTGNPAQLSNVTQMGGGFTTITSIMGSFNNVQIDHFSIGLGLRVDAGSSGTPNTFSTVTNADEQGILWGFWTVGSSGASLAKGGLFIGPVTGTTASWFVDSAFAVAFADERVGVGYYDLNMRGANTTCTWELANISAANSVNSRWNLTLDPAMGSVTGGFSDTNGVWSGHDTVTLNQYATLSGTTCIDGSLIIQNNAPISGITILSANTATGIHALLANALSTITDCRFEQGTGGHAVRCDTPGSYTWNGNTDVGYTGSRVENLVSNSGSTDAMFYNNSGGDITLTVGGGGQAPQGIRNGAGARTFVIAGAVTTQITVQDISTGTPLAGNVYLAASDGTGDLPFQEPVTITSVTTVATVIHTAHGLVPGNKVSIQGANEQAYNGAKTIVTVPTANSYTYTVDAAVADTATGTITSTGLVFADLADGTGVSPSIGLVSDTRTFGSNQPVTGRVRLSTTPGSFYKNAPITGTINSTTGLTITVQLISDE